MAEAVQNAVSLSEVWGNMEKLRSIHPVKKMAAEFFGTFALVFAGTGAIIINDVSNGTVTHVGVALTFGLIVMAMIYALGDVSGAHLNPAVTLGFVVARRFPLRRTLAYISAQCAGAVLASSLLSVLFPTHSTLGITLPLGPVAQSFVLEVILSCFLMFVILSVSTGAKEQGITAAIAIGSVVALDAVFAGPISGASMNPARSLGPAIVAMRFETLWLYLLAPLLGAIMAVGVCRVVQPKGCCSSATLKQNDH